MNWLIEHCTNLADRTAVVDQDVNYSYAELATKITEYQDQLGDVIQQGACVAVVSEYQFSSIAVFFALIEKQAVIVPIVSSVNEEVSKRIAVARCEISIRIAPNGALEISEETNNTQHSLVEGLKQKNTSWIDPF